MSGVTVVTLVPNAGDRLPRCLDSVAWADGLICIVDSKTTDGSLEVARSYTRHVEVREYVNAELSRNWALPQVKTEWTLVLDADEWVSEELAVAIQAAVADAHDLAGFRIKRVSYFMGARIRYCGWQRDYNLRLFRSKKGKYVEKRVHAHLALNGPVGRIDEVMYHDTYRNFEEFFATLQRFSTWGAQDLKDEGKTAKIRDLTLRPVLRFLKMYVLNQGFRDGYRGLVLCGLGAFSVFTKYAKLWNLERLEREKEEGPDADER